MDDVINERVSVILVDDVNKGKTYPAKLRWQGRDYRVTECTYHHRFKQGRTTIHVFSVACDHIYFKLSLNSETLHWTLMEKYDGSTS